MNTFGITLGVSKLDGKSPRAHKNLLMMKNIHFNTTNTTKEQFGCIQSELHIPKIQIHCVVALLLIKINPLFLMNFNGLQNCLYSLNPYFHQFAIATKITKDRVLAGFIR